MFANNIIKSVNELKDFIIRIVQHVKYFADKSGELLCDNHRFRFFAIVIPMQKQIKFFRKQSNVLGMLFRCITTNIDFPTHLAVQTHFWRLQSLLFSFFSFCLIIKVHNCKRRNQKDSLQIIYCFTPRDSVRLVFIC